MTSRRVFPETRTRDDAPSIIGLQSRIPYQRTAAVPEIVIGAPGYVAQLRAAGFALPKKQRRVPATFLAGGLAAVAVVAAGVGVALSRDPEQVTFALVPSEAPPASLVVMVGTGSQPEASPAGAAATETTDRAGAEMAAEDSEVAAASQAEDGGEAPVPTPPPAPPAATPPSSAPPPAPPKAPLSEAEFRSVALAAGWPAAVLDELVAVAMCESDLRPGAVGAGTYGLMQLVPWWFEASGVPFDTWADPLANLKASLYLYKLSKDSGSSGWHHWGCKP